MVRDSLKIYIAGPYTAATPDGLVRNVTAAIDAGLQIWKKGHFPYIPHLTHFIDARAAAVGLPMTYDEYISWDLEWLKVCDALLYLGSSKGADLELGCAESLGLKVYRSVHDICDVRRLTAEPTFELPD
jgi:hypothetical protein